MSSNENALPAPPIAALNPEAIEILRAWSAPGAVNQVVLNTTWDDAGSWGLLLVDLARHAAREYASKGHDPAVALNRIKQLFDAEWSHPTDSPIQLS